MLESSRSFPLSRIAESVKGEVLGNSSVQVSRLLPLSEAGPHDLGLLSDPRYLSAVSGSGAGALLVARKLVGGLPSSAPPCVVVDDPRSAMAMVLDLLYPVPPRTPSIHATAVLGSGVVLGEAVHIAPYAVLDDGVVLGDRVTVGAHSVVGSHCMVGDDTFLHPHVVLYPGVRVGKRVTLHSGVRLGLDGFGYRSGPEGHTKIRHVGGCEVGDDVELGGNCSIDRGSIGTTRLGEGTKLDNLVHIGHNVQIGKNVLLMGQVGMAGSTQVGDGTVMGGQAGVAGHLKVGAGARIGAQAGVIGDVPPGETVSGFPARNHRSFLRAMGQLFRLPELVARVARMEERLGITGSSHQDEKG
ncbi:MAG: UDP-3-O-(3-hydroxymyristoyl)glucosamine N-acyltransferase [Gemmatimonadota bacterium]